MNNIRPFSKKERKNYSHAAVTAVPQTASRPFAQLLGDSKSFFAERQLYENLKNNVPVINGAISKIVRLTGGFTVTCPDKKYEKLLSDFLANVCVGGNSVGIDAFIDLYLDQLLTYGTAVGEMIMNKDMRSFSLYNSELNNIVLKRNGKNPMQIDICNASQGTGTPVANQNTILISVLDPDAGRLHGNSLLKGLPFVSGVLMQIFESIASNWERMGNLRYAVTYRPQNDALEKAYAKDRALQIAKGWSDAMKSGNEIKDFIAVGDVDIKVIGADNQILDSEIPVRQLMEQIIAKTGLPPFMLGLNWSTTERMAQQQTDMLTSELYHYRRILTPVITKIATMFLRMNGCTDSCTVIWDDISLLDETEQAKARYYNAQAEKYHAEAVALGKGE
ncbi:MAG: serine/threonine protein phosphatase [Clostridia bacterium]|nr:serine/threonine protein phosphatase [Clostridia bacterium]